MSAEKKLYIMMSKCASQSLRAELKRTGTLEQNWKHDVPNKHGFITTWPGLSSRDIVCPPWWLGDLDRITAWTVIRNPYDKVVSAWLSAIQEKHVPAEFSLEEYCDLLWCLYDNDLSGKALDKVAALRRTYPDFFNNTQFSLDQIVGMIWKLGHNWESSKIFRPNFRVLQKAGDATGLCLPGASLDYDRFVLCAQYQADPSMFDLGRRHCHERNYLVPTFAEGQLLAARFENLQADMDQVCRVLDMPKLDLAKKKNVTVGKKNFMLYHSSKTLKFVEDFYALELLRGQYHRPAK